MSRTKKQPAKNFSEETSLLEQEPIEIVTNESQGPFDDEPIAEETHRVVRTWKKKVPVTERTPANEEQEIVYLGGEETVEDEKSLFRRRLRQIREKLTGDSAPLFLTVWRLPNFERDFNCSPSARKQICGTFPITFEEIEQLHYHDIIREKYAKGNRTNYFLVCVRGLIEKEDGRARNEILGYLDVVEAEASVNDVATPTTNDAGADLVGVRDPFQDLEKALRMVKRMNDTLGISTTLSPVETPKVHVEKLTTEAALLKLASEDPEQMAQVRDRIFGRANGNTEYEPEQQSIWAPIVKELAPNIPVLLQAVLLWLGGQAAAPAAPVAPVGLPPQPMPPMPPVQPEPMPQQAKTPTVIVLENLIGALANNANVKEVAAYLERLEQQMPDVGVFLNYLVEMDPDQVLEFIRSFYPQATPVTQLVHARHWVASLQQEMNAEPEEEGKGAAG